MNWKPGETPRLILGLVLLGLGLFFFLGTFSIPVFNCPAVLTGSSPSSPSPTYLVYFIVEAIIGGLMMATGGFLLIRAWRV